MTFLKRFCSIFVFALLLLPLTNCTPAPDPYPFDKTYRHTPAQFVDVASDSGLDFQHAAFRWGMSGDPVAMMGGGVCWLDYDNDGWQDLYVVNSYSLDEAGRWQSETGTLPLSTLYRNVEGRFEDVGEASGAAWPVRGNGCATADFDQNGFTDLYITTSRVNLLLWNNGDGTFTEGGSEAAVDPYGWQTAISIGDVNGDGWLDLFLAGYVDINNQIEGGTMGFPNTHYGIRDLFYVSNGRDENGRVTFREVGEIVGLETADFEYGLGSVLSDMDNDGDLDLFVANDTNPNRLYRNDPIIDDPEGIGFRFVEMVNSVAVDDMNSGMGVAAADYDNNGGPDIFITNMGHQYHSVYQHRPDFGFTNVSQVGFGVTDFGVDWTGWGTSWGDFDNDSDLDLFVSHGAIPVVDLVADREFAHLYENGTAQQNAGQFTDGTMISGLADGQPALGRGSAMADFDNDGDLDIAQATIGGELVLWRNETATGNWLVLDFESAVPGVKVKATLPNGATIYRELLAGSSYLAADEQRIHLGLGGYTNIESLEIRWLDGSVVERFDIVPNQTLRIDKP